MHARAAAEWQSMEVTLADRMLTYPPNVSRHNARGSPRIATVVGGNGCRSETRLRFCRRLVWWHDLVDQLSGFTLDVKRELVVPILFDRVG